MAEKSAEYPEYGFEKHVGYGTALHRSALDTLGVTPLHRTSFAPIAKMLRTQTTQPKKRPSSPTSKQIGDTGEDTACRFLEAHGHMILERNWKTRWCEIDIVSVYKDTTYFVEVKSRKNDATGDGVAAITPTKLKQMTFAAEYYVAKHPGVSGYQKLAVISITGSKLDYLEVE
jgi:uncharacterized protein (TIGR00252 family)